MKPEMLWENDLCLSLRLTPRLTLEHALQVHAMDSALARSGLPYIRARVPSYCTLMLHLRPDMPGMHEVEQDIHQVLATVPEEHAERELDCMDIPVCYDPAFAPDMEQVIKATGLDRAEVIRRHTALPLYVCMLGFLAGFPYLLGMDPTLACPRKDQPALRIPGGSVGIAGRQTGIYPVESPGGWQIIGRTPLTLFSPDRCPAALLKSGMLVRFRAIDGDEFARIQEKGIAYMPDIAREVIP